MLSLLLKFAGVVILFFVLMPTRFATRFQYIKSANILENLVPETTRNLSTIQLKECSYHEIIRDNSLYKGTMERFNTIKDRILAGGEYYPKHCRPKFSTAIIIPYRQRQSQLTKFLIYMHTFLQMQHIHYRLFLLEQHDLKHFNRAKLLNIGSEIAASYGFPCLIFHDVDLLPSSLGQLYVCTALPRHMCSNIDIFRFNLPYKGLFGGVVSIRTLQFQDLNGMSNLFAGWGGEDDDFYERIKSRRLNIIRFEPSYSQYVMMAHKKEKPNVHRHGLLSTGRLRYYSDGVNSLSYKKSLKIEQLFTRILVEA